MTAGTSPLNEEQGDWYVERFGKRYVRVQSGPANLPTRAARRRARRKSRLRNDGTPRE